MPMLVGGHGTRTTGSVWLGWDPAHPSQAQLEPLARSISVPSAPCLGPLSAVGWLGTSQDDVDEAVAAGARLIHAGGDAGVECAVGKAVTALGAADPLHVITSLEDSVAACGPEAAVAACTDIVARLGGQCVDILLLSVSSWGVAEDLLASGAVRSVGLHVNNVSEAVPALQRVLLADGAQPAVLCVPLHPLAPLVQRMLLGLCRRKGVRVLALDPLGGPDMASGVQAASMAATTAAMAAVQVAQPEPAEGEPPASGGAWQNSAVTVLLGWSVAREVIALPSKNDGIGPEQLLPLASELPPLPMAVRRALDELAPPNGTDVGFGPGRWVPPDHLRDRYEVMKTDWSLNWNRTEQ